MLTAELKHQTIETNGVHLHVVQAGPEDGKLVIMLHGFPEFWYGWKDQIEPLVQAGYRVWIPDQRGYNLSDKPKGVKAYTLDELAQDVLGLIEAAGQQKTLLVGHDWGANVAWYTAIKFPEKVERLLIMNVPHPGVFQKYLATHPKQLLKSWYAFFFQIPWLPEKLSSLGNWRGAVQGLKTSAKSTTFSEADLDEYRKAWSQPGAMTAMINWYRAILRYRPKPPANPRVTMPTLVIWGVKDIALSKEMAQLSVEMCDKGRLVYIDDATHWVQHDAAERVNKLMLDFLAGQD